MSSISQAPMPLPKTAIIVVHGVADQKPNETLVQLADLLITTAPNGSAYALEEVQEFGLQVVPLESSAEADQAYSGGRAPLFKSLRLGASTPSPAEVVDQPTPGGGRSLGKALLQSFRSDFHAHKARVTRDATRQTAALRIPLAGQPKAANAPPVLDVGVELTDFLLAKAARNTMPPAVYKSKRFRLNRKSHSGSEQVDLFEMYWADLSRLSSGVPRIVTELFTLLFRLSLLGRETVATAAREFRPQTGSFPKSSWAWFSLLQSCLDWAYSRLLATVFAQLALIALILIPAGLAAQYEVATPTLVSYLGVLMALVSLGLLVYRRTPSGEVSYPSYIALIAACYLGLWMLLSNWVGLNLKTLPSHWALGLIWLLFLTFIYDKFLRVCDERFPLTRFCGLLAWGMVLLIVVSSVAQASYQDAASSQVAEPILTFSIGALRALELVLLFMASWWVAAALMMLAWIVLSMVCANSHGHESRSTVATGRLGFIVSLGAFLLLTMALWSLLEPILEQSVDSLHYEAIWFNDSGAHGCARTFLAARFKNSIESLGGIVVLLSLLVLYLLLGFTPSIVAETKAGRLQFERLGRWLTRTYRYLDRVVLGIVLLGVLFAAGVALDIFSDRFFPLTNKGFHQWLNKFTFVGFGDRLSAHLSTLVQAAGGTTVALAALGGLLSRYLPWIRGPLDAALDVDNHFREFPRQGIPRARIFARYAALLDHIQEQGYERVVVVSHSQGTVITADLMHYLRARGLVLSNPSSPGPRAKGAIDPVKLWHWLSADRLKLLTMGSPLRQLYAARFPVLYRWIFLEVDKRGALAGRTQAAERLGPSPESIGAKVWWNAYTTGDYIGRWLWSGLPDTQASASVSQIDNLGVDGDVYERFVPVTGQEPISDVPQGSGAHTHYLDSDFAFNRVSTNTSNRRAVVPDTTNVAQLVDRLIAS